MRGPNKHDAFQARLDRIEEERQQIEPGGIPRHTTPRNVPLRQRNGRKKGGLLAIAALLMCGLGGGAFAFNKFTDGLDVSLSEYAWDKVVNVVARKPTVADHDGLLSSGPKERKLSDTGWELPAPYVIAPGRSDLTLDVIAVSAAVRAQTEEEPPTPDVSTFALNDQCTLRKPQAGEVVHNVTLVDTARYTHLHTFSKSELAEAVIDRVEGINAHTRHYKNTAIAKGRMGQVDVFVTDTSAPVYLVLQVFDKDVLWNLHLAEGVTLAHVAMIGNKSGFAAPAGGFTYEALRIRDFVAEDDLYENEARRPCMIAPWRKPQADWPLIGKQDDQHSAHIYRDQKRRSDQGYAAYQAWYQGQLGTSPETNISTAVRAAYALVGPVPQVPVVHTPVAEQKMYLAQSDYVVFDDEELDAVHVDLLTAAAGGDLEALKPGIMVRAQPAVGATGIDDAIEVVSAPPIERWWADITKARPLFNMHELNKERTLRARVRVRLRALLNPGEKMPEDVFKSAYAMARTPAYMATLCQELLNTIAQKCDVTNVKSKLTTDDVSEMSALLRFVPKTHPGKVIVTENAEIVPVKYRLPKAYMMANLPPDREALFRAADARCAKLREVTGNCVITDVWAETEQGVRYKGRPLMKVRFDMAYYGDPSTVDMDALQASFRAAKSDVELYKRK